MHYLRRCCNKIYFLTNSYNNLHDNILGYHLIRSYSVKIPLRELNFCCERSDKTLTQNFFKGRSDNLLSKTFSRSQFHRLLQDFIKLCILFEDVATEYIFSQNLITLYTVTFLIIILADLTR